MGILLQVFQQSLGGFCCSKSCLSIEQCVHHQCETRSMLSLAHRPPHNPAFPNSLAIRLVRRDSRDHLALLFVCAESAMLAFVWVECALYCGATLRFGLCWFWRNKCMSDVNAWRVIFSSKQTVYLRLGICGWCRIRSMLNAYTIVHFVFPSRESWISFYSNLINLSSNWIVK